MEVRQSFSYYIENNPIEDPINIKIRELVDSIKFYKDYEQAINLIQENNLTLEKVAYKTVRLRKEELARLADLLISKNEKLIS